MVYLANGFGDARELHIRAWISGNDSLSSDATGRPLPLVMMLKRTGEPLADQALREDMPSDEKLMARIAAQDHGALGLLFDRYCNLVLGVAMRVLRNRTEAEEVVQDVFLYVYRKAAIFDPKLGSARNWLLHAAHYRALTRRMSLNKLHFYVGTDLAEVEENVMGTPDIEQQLGAKFSAEQVRKEFLDLPERQRVTLEMFFFEGLTLREISQRLDEPLGNVRHHYYRGVKKLQNSAAIRGLRRQ